MALETQRMRRNLPVRIQATAKPLSTSILELNSRFSVATLVQSSSGLVNAITLVVIQESARTVKRAELQYCRTFGSSHAILYFIAGAITFRDNK